MIIFLEGFDKYGLPANPVISATAYMVQAMLANGVEWTSTGTLNTNNTLQLVNGLSGPGSALRIVSQGNINLYKSLANNFSRLIVGFGFSSSLAQQVELISFTDGGNSNSQSTVTLETGGQINLRTGGIAGTVLALGNTNVVSNAAHYLEVDITFGAHAAYALYLDGLSIAGGVGATINNTDNFANGISFGSTTTGSSSADLTIDNLYVFDNTTTVCNSVLNTNPVIETSVAASDSAVTFTPNEAVLGYNYNNLNNHATINANTCYLTPITPKANMTLNGIFLIAQASISANVQAVLYAVITSGSSSELVIAGVSSTLTALTANTPTEFTFSNNVVLTGNQSYYIGFITDTNLPLFTADGYAQGFSFNNTYTSGAPNTAPALTTGQPTVQIWGVFNALGSNFVALLESPPTGLANLSANTVGKSDLFTFNPLQSVPREIYGVGVKGFVSRDSSGVRGVSLMISSNQIENVGTNPNAATQTNAGWVDSYFTVDPSTNGQWQLPALNAALVGYGVTS